MRFNELFSNWFEPQCNWTCSHLRFPQLNAMPMALATPYVQTPKKSFVIICLFTLKTRRVIVDKALEQGERRRDFVRMPGKQRECFVYFLEAVSLREKCLFTQEGLDAQLVIADFEGLKIVFDDKMYQYCEADVYDRNQCLTNGIGFFFHECLEHQSTWVRKNILNHFCFIVYVRSELSESLQSVAWFAKNIIGNIIQRGFMRNT